MFILSNYIVLLLITILVVYILYRLISKRSAASAKPSSTSSHALPYSDTPTSAQSAQLNSIRNTAGSGITNVVLDSSNNNSLRNFCIKSSFNSAATGSYVSQGMVKYVLSRGCRFLDFEVFIKDGQAIVAYSSSLYDPSYTHFTSLNPSLSLAGVFQTIMSNAFNQTAPNPGDPLFIQLRVKTYLSSAYSEIAKIISANLSDRLYKGVVTPDTDLGDLLGKIVIVFDKSSSPGYDNYSVCAPSNLSCTSLKPLVNMVSGSDVVRIYKENDLMMQSTNPPDPYVYLMRIVMPQSVFLMNIVNSDSQYLIKNYGAQIILQAFYVNDEKLAVYENMFKKYNSAFVPITKGTR